MTDLRQKQPRIRPPMPPLAVRVEVAERQFVASRSGEAILFYLTHVAGKSDGKKLDYLLHNLFGDAKIALDHSPALILRDYFPRGKDIANRYRPHAHSSDHLIYLEKADHQQKTTGRKPGAERTVTTKGSDIWVKTKFARLEGKPKRKEKIPQRRNPWPKRKFRK